MFSTRGQVKKMQRGSVLHWNPIPKIFSSWGGRKDFPMTESHPRTLVTDKLTL